MRTLRSVCFSLALAVPLVAAQAADFVNLGWGDFKLSFESSTQPKSVEQISKNGEMGLSVKLDSFSAGADGARLEGSASFEGEYTVQQPAGLKLPVMSVQLRGTVIKTPGTTAEMIVEIGNVKQTIAWDKAEAVAGSYSKVLTIENPDGQLPTPFPLKVQAFVGRAKGTGGVLLTLDSIDVRVGQPNVAHYFEAEPKFTARYVASTEAGKQVLAAK